MICRRQVILELVVVVTLSICGPLAGLAQVNTAAPTSSTSPDKSAETFGEEVTLKPKTIAYLKGSGSWDSAFTTIVNGFKSVKAYLNKAGVKPSGSLITIYTATDANGFQFQAAMSVTDTPNEPLSGDIVIGKSPGGRAFKFLHHGSYASMGATYDAITSFLEKKGIDAKELFVEEYVTDPTSTPEDELVVEIYVPVK